MNPQLHSRAGEGGDRRKHRKGREVWMFPGIFPGAYLSCVPRIKKELARQEVEGMSVEGAAHTEAGDSKNRQSFLSSGLLGRSHSHRACFSNIKVRREHLGVLVKLQILLQVGPEILQFLGAPKRGPCCFSADHTLRSKARGF